MEIKQVSINSLKPSEYNPRKASKKEYDDLKQSIERFGLIDPIIVNLAPERKNIIIGGHFRVRVAKGLGMKEVPVVYVDIPDIKKEQELNLRLNKNLGEFDYDLLANFNEDLLLDVGFESDELDQIFDLNPDDDKADAVPEPPKKPKSKLGDLWILGKHRLLCGDCTVKSNIDRLMSGKKADMVFTDPPYGIDLDTDYSKYKATPKSFVFKKNVKGKKYPKIKGDKDFNADFIFQVFSYCKEIFLFGAEHYVDTLPYFGKKGTWFVWKKRKESQYVGIGNPFELIWSYVKHKRIIYDFEWFGFLSKEDAKEAQNRLHPTMKPTKLIARIIKKEFGKRDSLIIDLFLGSGSTLIACEKTNRVLYGCEIEPIYIDVILDRWAQYTGLDPVRENGAKWSAVKNE